MSEASCVCAALGADYAQDKGVLSLFDPDSGAVAVDLLPAGVAGDSVLRHEEGRLAVIGRFGANRITLVETGSFAVTREIYTGERTNPQDVAWSGDELWATTFGGADDAPPSEIQRWSVIGGTEPLSRTSLASLSAGSADGSRVEPGSVRVVDDALWITLSHLGEDFLPTSRGTLAVLSMTNNATLETRVFTHPNPVGFLRPFDDAFVVGTSATPATAPRENGCLESVPRSGAPACLVPNAELEGFATATAMTPSALWIVASAGVNDARLVARSNDGALTRVELPQKGVPTDVAACPDGQLVVVADRRTGGIWVYDTVAGTWLREAPIDIGLPAAFSAGLACWAP